MNFRPSANVVRKGTTII